MPGSRSRGFTLIEVLVALTMLGVAAGLLLAAQAGSLRLARQALETENALWLARSRLVEAAAWPDRAPPEDAQADHFEGIDYQTRIEYRELSPDPDVPLDELPRARRLVEIMVRVSWQGARPSAVQLTTYRKLSG